MSPVSPARMQTKRKKIYTRLECICKVLQLHLLTGWQVEAFPNLYDPPRLRFLDTVLLDSAVSRRNAILFCSSFLTGGTCQGGLCFVCVVLECTSLVLV